MSTMRSTGQIAESNRLHEESKAIVDAFIKAGNTVEDCEGCISQYIPGTINKKRNKPKGSK